MVTDGDWGILDGDLCKRLTCMGRGSVGGGVTTPLTLPSPTRTGGEGMRTRKSKEKGLHDKLKPYGSQERGDYGNRPRIHEVGREYSN